MILDQDEHDNKIKDQQAKKAKEMRMKVTNILMMQIDEKQLGSSDGMLPRQRSQEASGRQR